MKQTGFSLADRWRRRRLFILSLFCIACILALDLMTVLSFDSFPKDIAVLADSEEIYTVFEEWYTYIGYFFSVCFYLILLGIMCVLFLTNAWENRFQLIPALLIWCSSLGVLSALGHVGKLLTASHPNTFSQVSDGLGQLSFLPLLLCIVYYMRCFDKLFVPIVLANCFCSSGLLFALAWGGNPAIIYVMETLSDGALALCFLAVIVFGIAERVKKNENFRPFVAILILSVVINTGFRVFVLLLRNGFVLARVHKDIVNLSVSLSYVRQSWLEDILFLAVAMLIVTNYLQQYHKHTMQLQSIRLRNEANLEYARSLQRYETDVRKIKHDIGNTLNVALMLCKNGEYDRLQDYLGTTGSQISNLRTGNYCAHILTNYILLMFEERFVQCGSKFRCKALLPSDLEIADTDLAGELNNILQNALDAVQKLPETERWVEITVRLEQSVVRIDCRNPYLGEPRIAENGLLHSSKEDREYHGFGLQIIYEIAEKYGGVAVPLFGDGVFEIKVALPNGNPSAGKSS